MSQTITLIKDKILSDNYFTLRNITYDLTRRNGEVIRHRREVYDRGNGATILLYNSTKKTVVLVRQFRVATWVNGNQDGMLIETCAGLLDNDEPEVCIRKEAIEETG
ncbi:NUDIX domain-containing protein, partial [Salmonella enterica subsp. enterica serovar Anatum]|nr:NUDIX domain-containing protein [Salmonella enterica subsp. enterica serovar Anatum]